MRSNLRAFSLFLCAIASTGCASLNSTAAAPYQAEKSTRGNIVEIQGFVESREFEDFDFEDNAGTSFDIEGLERDRAGLQFRIGRDSVRGVFEVFAEEYSFPGVEAEGFGVGIGVKGVPRVGDQVALIIPYGVGFAASLLEDDPSDDELLTVEIDAEFGLGVSVNGFAITAGFEASAIGAEGDSDNTQIDNADGSNAGVYFGVRYARGGIPVVASFRVIGGDLEGVEFSLGGAF